jgi:hypothetical protein
MRASKIAALLLVLLFAFAHAGHLSEALEAELQVAELHVVGQHLLTREWGACTSSGECISGCCVNSKCVHGANC